ncbi:SAM-dependent methyltransferase, partial [Kibdelosporangium lantanae]
MGDQPSTRVDEWVPASVDVTVPSMARTYDFLLGGGHNFAPDRDLAVRVEQLMPGAGKIARLNRAFLGRAVRFLTDQ